MYSMLFGGARGDADAIEDDDDIVDMVEGNLEDDMEQRNQEDMRRLARQQEEVSDQGFFQKISQGGAKCDIEKV